MPLYEWVCPKCGNREERICFLEPDDVVVCPKCDCLMEKVYPKIAFHKFVPPL